MEVKISKDIEASMKEAVVKIKRKVKGSGVGPDLYKRDENGLLENVDYIFNDDGSVDWRSMIKDEHLFPNKGWFESRKKSVPRSVEGLKDYQLLIKLSGIKELARLRGFESVSYYSDKCELNHVAVCCTMTFIGNYETGGGSIVFQDMANATLENTSSFATKFLETIACNRAFVRCVRNFLNIHIVGDDEIDKSDSLQPVKFGSESLSPQGILKNEAALSGISNFESFINTLRGWHRDEVFKVPSSIDPSSWSGYTDIPPKYAREFLKILKNN
jgi:hypothetical protein